jgi:hypothetical protein
MSEKQKYIDFEAYERVAVFFVIFAVLLSLTLYSVGIELVI